ncbi:MAG: sugar phosphate nucleotidyltransferase [Chloroflexi bacterium]|nr:sugar phosphate nucleotidyltransferase [Chloroflexota bacterium]
MKAVILAGGLGRRLAPYTTILPKPLMPVGDRPILEILLRRLKQHGVVDVTICVGYLRALVEAYFGDGEKLGLQIAYSYEEEPLGTAGPLALIGDVQEPFIVANGDLLTDLDFSDMIVYHRSHGCPVTIALTQRDVCIDYGVVEVDGECNLERYIEKPSYSYYVSMGIYILSPDVLRMIPRNRRYDLPELVQALVNDTQRVKAYMPDCNWLDIGLPDDYERAHELMEKLDLPEE